MARGVGNGTAEDIVQDVMIKVWTKAGSFDPAKASFATWVYRMTRNRWIDHKRKHGRMDVRDPDLMKIIADDEVQSAEVNFMAQQNSDILKRTDLSLNQGAADGYSNGLHGIQNTQRDIRGDRLALRDG